MRGAGLRGGLGPGPFEEAHEGWNTGRLTQAEAAQVLGMCEPVPFQRTPRNVKGVVHGP